MLQTLKKRTFFPFGLSPPLFSEVISLFHSRYKTQQIHSVVNNTRYLSNQMEYQDPHEARGELARPTLMELLLCPLLLDIHPPAATLPVHDAATSRDPTLPGGPAAPGEKDPRQQQGGRRILHPQARSVRPVP